MYENFEEEDDNVKDLDLEEAISLMQKVLKNSQLSDIQTADFTEWFNKLARRRNDENKKVIQMSTKGDFAKLFELCSRRRSQLSLPVQTFLPLRQI